jgi:hypothetical protein
MCGGGSRLNMALLLALLDMLVLLITFSEAKRTE